MVTEDELRAGLGGALRAAGIDAAEILMSQDPYDGWRVVVLERPSSLGVPAPARWLPPELDREIASLSFRSVEDRGDVTELLKNELAEHPLWPEALARGRAIFPTVPRFAADLNVDLPPPIVTTFYSLRGGVGRSTALAYVARILARDNRVLCVDMDLEAPGLAALFGVEDQVDRGQGVVPLLVRLDLGDEPDLDEHLIRVAADSELYLLPAGLPSATYARQLAQIDPVAYYHEETNPLRLLLEMIKSSRLAFDVILLDSRTGISPLSAPLLFDLADLAVVAFFPHPQAYRGTGALVRALLRAKTARLVQDKPLTPSPHFLISPLPAADRETAQRYEERALEQLSSWVDGMIPPDDAVAFSPDQLAEITTFVAYDDRIAVSDDVLGPDDISRPYEPLAEWIAGYLPSSGPELGLFEDGAGAALSERAVVPVESALVRALDELPFNASVAEQQDSDDFHDSFVRTRATDLALRAETILVIGRKGTGKTAIFRRLKESVEGATAVLAPPSRLADPWLPGSNEFKLMDDYRRAAGHEWRVVWQLLTALVTARQEAGTPVPGAFGSPEFLSDRAAATPTSLLRDLRVLLGIPDVGLLSRDWLVTLGAASKPRRLLLFDGLDTGFGGSAVELARRNEAVAGLLEMVGEVGHRMRRLTFKILLRADIWDAVNIPNKSHFFGRQVRLAWNDSAEYLNVAVTRAMRSPAFRELLEGTLEPDTRGLLSVPADRWPPDMSERAWRLLVGDRIAGSKTAFTMNWVWRRLADGNDDHTPRSLIQLLMSSQRREQALRQHAEPTRSIIRPRTLVDSLEDVSREALIALREEFSELEPVFDALRGIGQTPFDPYQLEVPSADLRRLAQEVGLLTVQPGAAGQPERFRVPELYRLELQMGRKGQR
jgi:cellulose biosynthesis protein BcsQ